MIIGVTGGIGSGKSTVSKMLIEFGAVIIDADQIAREVVTSGKPALKEISITFGDGILKQNGELNRAALADIVFSDKDKLETLNKIIHKYVNSEIKSVLREYQVKNIKLIVLDVPIPTKEGFIDLVDTVWVVISEIDKRVERAMLRSNLSKEQVEKRINNQLLDSEYISIADEVIENNSTIEDLRLRVRKLLEQNM